MADEQFYTILTNKGKAKIANATLLNSNVTLTTLKVGDGNGAYYNPTEEQTDLKNVVHTCQVGSISIDKKNPNWVVVETIIPGSVGGFIIREIGLFDTEGDMIAVGKYPETYKPVVANGASKDLNVRTIFEVSNAENVTLNINPSVIIATKEDINNLQEQITDNATQLNDLANPNLLINGGFQVAQRGTTFSTINSKYTLDRWCFNQYATGSVEKVSNGVKLTSTSEYFWMTQYFEEDLKAYLSGKTITCSLMLSTGTKIVLTGVAGSKNLTTPWTENVALVFTDTCEYQIRVKDGSVATIVWAKLELGAVATPFIPRPYGEELALCQRFYYEENWSNVVNKVLFKIATSNCDRGSVCFPVTMRINPTLSITWSDETESHAEYIQGKGYDSLTTSGFTPFVNRTSEGMNDINFVPAIKKYTADAEIY